VVVDLLQRMVDAGITPTQTTYSRAIAACVNSDPPMVDEAIALLAAAPTPPPTDKRKTLAVRKAHSKIILALGKARPPRIDDALGLLAQMEKTDGIGADGFTHSTMVSACAAVHPATPETLATALEVVDKMVALGHPIDQYTISALMRCCVGIPDQAAGLFRLFVAGGDVVVNRHVRRNLRKALTDDSEYDELVNWSATVAPATSLDVDRVRPNGTVKLAQTDADREARGKKRERTRKRPDWDCGSCGVRNFGFRTSCFKCAAPKPAAGPDASVSNAEPQAGSAPGDDAPVGRDGGWGVTAPAFAGETRKGDWKCPGCNNHN